MWGGWQSPWHLTWLGCQCQARELRFLQHPRIVGYEDDFLHTTPQSAVRDAHVHVCIIMELCERDLRQQLEDKRGAGAMFSEEQLLKYLAQICSALSYCHGKFIIHRGAHVATAWCCWCCAMTSDVGLQTSSHRMCSSMRTTTLV